MKKATCTWGEGPDVILSLKDDFFILYEDPRHNNPPQGDYIHGYVTCGSMNLTSDEALDLASQLSIAANYAKELEKSLEMEK